MALTEFNNSRSLNCAGDSTDKDEVIAWAKTIPLEELWDKIRELTGIADLSFEHSLSTGVFITIFFHSQDLTDKIGFLKLMYARIRIEDYDGEISAQRIDGVLTRTWWGSACFTYKHPDGTGNMIKFLEWQYVDGRGWEFTSYSSDT